MKPTVTVAPWTLPPTDASGHPLGHGRGDELHVGDVVRHFYTAVLGKKEDPITDAARLRMQLGFVWECEVERALANEEYPALAEFCRRGEEHAGRLNMLYQPRLVVDDIHGTPDAVCFKPRRLEQYKATAKSVSKTADFEGNFERWLMMDAAYLYMASVEFGILFDTVVYRVLFKRGDYGAEQEATRLITATFSESDIRDHWTLIKGVADGMRRGE